jgi:general secretion pathway protein D
VRIIPDEENNLLVVVAPPHEWNVISRLLKSLDIMPRQVLSEVLIVEVKLTDELKYGVEWFLGNRPASASTVVAGTTDTTGATTTGAIGATSVAAGLEVLTGASAAFSQATGGFVFIAQDVYRNLKGLINVLAAEGKVSILASPHIMAANNQEARIQIGDEVPILTSQSVPMISQATSFQTSTVQYRSTGIILIVKPQINAKGMVTLEISQEVSSAATTATGVSNSPTISVRQAKTSLITGDNQTIVLGGLIREDWTHTQQGIPGLKRVPLLGPLFGSEGKKSEKTELLVLITPHIITNLEEGARITQEMKDKTGVEETTPQQRRGKAPLSTSPGPPTAPRP